MKILILNYTQKTKSDSFYMLPTDNNPGGWIEPQIWEGHSPNTIGPNLLEYSLARWRNYDKDTWSIIPIENSVISNIPIVKQEPLIIGIDPLVTGISTSLNNKWEAVKCFVDICLNVVCEIEITQGVDYMKTAIAVSRHIQINKGPMRTISSNISNLRRSQRIQQNNIIKSLAQQHQGPIDIQAMKVPQQQQRTNAIPPVYAYLTLHKVRLFAGTISTRLT